MDKNTKAPAAPTFYAACDERVRGKYYKVTRNADGVEIATEVDRYGNAIEGAVREHIPTGYSQISSTRNTDPFYILSSCPWLT